MTTSPEKFLIGKKGGKQDSVDQNETTLNISGDGNMKKRDLKSAKKSGPLYKSPSSTFVEDRTPN